MPRGDRRHGLAALNRRVVEAFDAARERRQPERDTQRLERVEVRLPVLVEVADVLPVALEHVPVDRPAHLEQQREELLREVVRPVGRDVLLRAAKGYQYARSEAGGGPVFWRRDRYGLLHCRGLVLARSSFMGHLTGRKSTLPDSVANLAVLCDDDTGAEVAVVNYHLTAEVQYGGAYRTDKAHRSRVRRHKREVRRLSRLVRRQQRKGRRVFLLGDGNFDGLQIKGLTSCWTGPDLPAGGTLGNRRVDIIFAATPPRHVRTVQTASDHDAVIADY